MTTCAICFKCSLPILRKQITLRAKKKKKKYAYGSLTNKSSVMVHALKQLGGKITISERPSIGRISGNEGAGERGEAPSPAPPVPRILITSVSGLLMQTKSLIDHALPRQSRPNQANRLRGVERQCEESRFGKMLWLQPCCNPAEARLRSRNIRS